ncbi:MAG TPA: hypothetical protein VKH63_17710 [Candidatus Acidoferrum sp.]|nr:hypothetical protein [Candidatus Acidoferrum sp.]
MTVPSLNKAGQVDGQIILHSYRQLYDFIDANKDIALRYFQLAYREIEA